MAKKVTKVLKLQVPAGAANPAPPLGPVLGQAGVNIGAFVNEFNTATMDKKGQIMTVVMTVYDDRSFEWILKSSPVSSLIKKAAGISSGSGKNAQKKVGKITSAQVREIALEKLPDLNCTSVEAAMRQVEGSCRSLGVDIVG
jgi:large subunit ribosomal protein L11